MKIIISLLFFFLLSCSSKSSQSTTSNTFIKGLSLDSIKNNDKKWTLLCKHSILDEDNSLLKCYDTEIHLYKNKKISSIMKSMVGYADLNKNSFYLKNNVSIVSKIDSTILYSEEVNFDSKREIIYSKIKTRVIKEKDNVEIISQGFEAKSDLTNIKFFNHTTKTLSK